MLAYRTSPERINGVYCWPSEYKIHETKAPRCKESRRYTCSSVGKYSRTVERDDIDCLHQQDSRKVGYKLTSAHLLRNHNNSRCLSGSADSRDCKQFGKPGEEVCVFSNPSLLNQDFLLAEKAVRIIQISGSLNFVLSKTAERTVFVSFRRQCRRDLLPESLQIALLLHKPSR
jgi:hypothetical protein